MAVRFGEDAVQTLARLVTTTTSRVDDLLVDRLPDGVEAVEPAPGGDPSRWLLGGTGPVTIGGWGDPGSYVLVEDDALRARLTGTVPADLGTLSPAEQDVYVRHSVDLAMRGGAASGVVYPFAVCEIAREMRVRNVGGASAGAIAAACTAAAELGRSSGAEGASPGPVEGPGHLRAGFSGLADLMTWMLQIDDGAGRTGRGADGGADRGAGAEPGSGPEEFRLAQLFRPVRSQHDVFNVAVAVMRRRYWAVPLAYGWAVGWPAQGAVVVLAVLAALALGALTDPVLAPVLLTGALVVLAGLLSGTLLGVTWRQQRRQSRSAQTTSPLQRLADEASSRPAQEHARANAVVGVVLVVAALVLVVVGFAELSTATVLQTVVVTLSLVLLASLVLLGAVARWVLTAGERSYGLLSGATPAGRPPLLSRLLGAPAPTVDRALVPWLADSLAELAGMPGTVLRFGHLWQGPGFEPVPESDDGGPTEGEALVRGLAGAPGRRLVNLEMMTTDLSRGRPFRFPLAVAEPDLGPSGGAEALWFDPGDLCIALAGDGRTGSDVLPREVVEAMTALTPRRTVPLADGSTSVTLHRLPHPWNLPVVLAVRISLALPVLFTAVRLYRLLPGGEVRDDLGRTLRADGEPIPSQAHPLVAQPLWWSDGGITSNFPVHLFDSALPRWPSFGLNLGTHPPGQPTQDVWLPQDWNVALVPAGDLGSGFGSLLGAVLGAARNWRDTLQSAMPGFRSRVAAVRQHPSEGGVSLFMPRATVAALALRGAVAGARLRERFRDDAQWERHRWLRLRVAAGALEDTRARVARVRPLYEDLLKAQAAGLAHLADVMPGDPSLPPQEAWFVPVEQFWEHVGEGLDAMTVPRPDPGLVAGGPTPEPTFALTPPT